MTEELHLSDAELGSCRATVLEVRPPTVADGDEGSQEDGGGAPGTGAAVLLDRTVLYATGGGQPHDVGTLGGREVVDVVHDRQNHDDTWHVLAAGEDPPAAGEEVEVVLDTDRRRALMRTHTAMHILCGVMWRDHGVVVTGGNMEPLSGRLDFEFPDPPEGFAPALQEALNAEVMADRPVRVSFLPRGEAVLDERLIRTKVNLVPESVTRIRVVDIEGLDRQADGGTHVARTGEVGGLRVAKVQSKGKGYRRVRLEVLDELPRQ